MIPESGCRMPVSMFMVVDLPAPLWPNRQNIYPSNRLRLSLSTIILSSKVFVRSFRYMLIFFYSLVCS